MPATNKDVDAAAAYSRIGPDLETYRASFGTILIDPPWRFTNRTGKVAPEHKRLRRYNTMTFDEITALPVGALAKAKSHLYLWYPNALIYEALQIMQAWGFTYKTNIVWLKVTKDGKPDGRGVGFYFRNVTELLLSILCLRVPHEDGLLVCAPWIEHVAASGTKDSIPIHVHAAHIFRLECPHSH